MEVHLQLGVTTKEEVEELQAAAMSLGRIMAETTLEQLSLKAHGEKWDSHQSLMYAEDYTVA